MKKGFYLIVLLIISSGTLLAQKFDADELAHYKSQYPDDQAIFLKNFESVDIKIVGDSLRIVKSITKEMLHLGSQSSIYAKDGIHSSSFYKTENISAKTLVPDKKKYKTLEVTEFKETYDKNSYVFYDDTRSINFFFPGVQEGAITQLNYDQKISEPKFLSGFLFQEILPVVHSKYTITTDPDVEMRLDVLNDDSLIVTKSVKSVDGRKQYVFEASNLKKLKFESDAPPIRYSGLHVVSIIKSYKSKNSETHNILSSPKDLFNWYSGFIKGLKTQKYENVANIVSQIVDPKDSELEKVRKIFYWVQNNIKYIAFEEGMRGLIPHNAAYVCDKRYGDCKDMASIVINMLHEAGVNAYFTWIGTRDIPYKYSEYPSPMVDNHMIATYIKDDKYYFLDATSQYSSFELPSAMIQGKEALIARSESEFEIKVVPEINKELNHRVDSITFKLENGKVLGEGKLFLYGYPKVNNSHRMTRSSKTEVDNFINGLLQKGSNKFFVSDYEINNLDNLDKPIEVDYDFKIEDYYRTIGDKIYFNMNLDKSFANDIIDEGRVLPREYDFKFTNSSYSVLNIPENYTVSRIPTNKFYNSDLFGFNIEYQQIDNKIILKRSFFVDKLLIEPSDFQSWNQGLKNLNDAYRDVLILEKSGN